MSYEEVTARGGVVTSDVLRHEFVPAPAQVAHHLGLTAEGEVVALERLRYVDDEPWSLSLTWLPPRLGELIDDRSEEHTSELQSRGHLVCRLLLEKKNHLSTL